MNFIINNIYEGVSLKINKHTDTYRITDTYIQIHSMVQELVAVHLFVYNRLP